MTHRSDDVGPVTIRTCRTLQEAEVLRSVLEAGGISAFIPDENFAGLMVPDALHTDGVRLQVSSEDVDIAREILEREAD
jgi:hypothetical protein